MAELRKLTKELCDKCIFMPERDNGCNYMGVTGESRIFANGKKVVPAGYCDKFIEGPKISKRIAAWGHSDMTLIYSDEGGRIYERNYKKDRNDIDSSDADS